MKPEFRNNKDFWAGMMFLGIGAAAMFIARDYPYGTTLRMGPGYFPINGQWRLDSREKRWP